MASYNFDGSVLSCGGDAILEGVPGNLTFEADYASDDAGHLTATGGVFITAKADNTAERLAFDLGKLVDVDRFACGHRDSIWWMRPAVGDDVSSMPVETQFAFFRRNDGRYVLLLSMLDGPFRSAFVGSEGGRIQAYAQTGDPSTVGDEVTLAYMIVADEPYWMMDFASNAVLARSGCGRLREEKRVPEAMRYLGWCTWDAFYQEVSHEKVREGLEAFRKAGVEPRFMILDDGWQSVRPVGYEGKQRVLSAFEANGKFPDDLWQTVAMAKDEFSIEHFYVWHAVQGYWSGVDEKLEKYGSRMTKKQWSPEIEAIRPGINDADIPAAIVPPDRAFLFFNDYYRHLAAQGVDGVKVDSQCVLEACGMGYGGRVAMMRAYHEAFEAAASIHLGGNIINCMCGSNDVSYSAIVSNVARTSNDFMPKQPESHGLHIWQNAMTSMFVGQFAMPDWDMFHSSSAFGEFHAMARAISGGPVYVSDKPGEHDAEVLKKLVLAGGLLPMCEDVARPTLDSMFVDPMREKALLKIFNSNADTDVIGFFNVQAKAEGSKAETIKGSLRANEFYEFEGNTDAEFAVYLHKAGTLQMLRSDDVLKVELGPLSAEIATISQVMFGFAPIGLVDRYNSGGTFRIDAIGEDGCELTLLDGGRFVAYCSQRPSEVASNAGGDFEYDEATGRLQIDIEADAETWDGELHIAF